MVRVVAFVGSARKKGNVDTIVDKILHGVREKEGCVKKFYLNALNIKGCQGCLYCRNVPDCAIKDDMQEIYEEIKKADYVIIGSPVYICQVSAQTKLLLDRLYPFTEIDEGNHTPRFGKKKLIMVYTQAAPFSFLFKRYFRYTSKHLKGMGLEHYKTIVGTKMMDRNSAKNNKRILNKAYKLGISIGEK